jgi:hypothetical protein
MMPPTPHEREPLFFNGLSHSQEYDVLQLSLPVSIGGPSGTFLCTSETNVCNR